MNCLLFTALTYTKCLLLFLFRSVCKAYSLATCTAERRESEDKITIDEENSNRSVNPPTMTGKKHCLGKKKKKNSAAVILPFKLKIIFKDVKLNY